MIRVGHIDIAFLGALKVDEQGYVANWAIPGQNIQGVGGAMDLLSAVKRVVVTVSHTAMNGQPKIVKKCTYPLRKVDLIITELAVFKFDGSQLVLKELMSGATVEEVTQKTSAFFVISETIQKNY